MLAIAVASLAVLPAAVALLVRHGAAAMRMGVPFGPFLSLGAVVVLLVG
jgi:prepilin signal peptidase PulO-like enzyme (type II secretory pathway)